MPFFKKKVVKSSSASKKITAAQEKKLFNLFKKHLKDPDILSTMAEVSEYKLPSKKDVVRDAEWLTYGLTEVYGTEIESLSRRGDDADYIFDAATVYFMDLSMKLFSNPLKFLYEYKMLKL